jgi:hypothetical protein
MKKKQKEKPERVYGTVLCSRQSMNYFRRGGIASYVGRVHESRSSVGLRRVVDLSQAKLH